jgi:hypothetical protein
MSQIRESPNFEDQVPVFISPQNMVTQLCPQARGFLFVASYGSQSYGEGIRPLLDTGFRTSANLGSSVCSLGTDQTENTASNSPLPLWAAA